MKKVLTLLTLMLSLVIISQGQSTPGKYPSHCNAPDSIRTSAREYALAFIRQYLIDANRPEKDSLIIDSTLIEKVTDAVTAVYYCDSLPFYDSIANGFWFNQFGSFKDLYFPLGEVRTDPNSKYSDTLCSSYKFSGDPKYDTLAARFSLWPDGCYIMYAKGSYNILPLRDSISSVSWVTYIGEPINPIGGGPPTMRMKIDKDTVYLMYALLTWDCPSGCWYKLVVNYKVYPDCSIDYLGRSVQVVDVPVKEEFFKTKDYYCGDSVKLTIPGSWRKTEWSNGSDSSSEVFTSSGDQWVKAYPLDTLNGLIKIQRFHINLIKTSQYRWTGLDTAICHGDSVRISLPDSNVAAYVINQTTPGPVYQTPAWLGDTGMYQIFKPNCFYGSFHIRNFIPGRIAGPDTITICKGDQVILMTDSVADHYSWSTGDTSLSLTVKDTGWYSCCFDGRNCLSCDSVYVRNYAQPNEILNGDTTIGYSDTFRVSVDSSYREVRWFNGDTLYQISIDTTILGTGTHWISVDVTDSNGCEYRDSLAFTRKPFVGIQDLKNHLMVPHPNPFTTFIQVDEKLKGKTYHLTDPQGREIRTSVITDPLMIPLGNIAPGTYILQVSFEENDLYYRLIRE